MSEILTDRWVFTQSELKAPDNCTADDLFWADTFPEKEDDEPEHVLVNRRGEPLRMHGNGIYGGIGEMRDDLDLDTLVKDEDEDKPSEDYLADEWRNVIIDQDGKFVAFQES